MLYLLLAFGLLSALGPAALAESAAPLREAVAGSGSPVPDTAVTLAAALASLGALLALIAGVGRITLAMAREGDRPRVLARIWQRFGVPYAADLATAVVVIALLLTTDVLTVVGFSSHPWPTTTGSGRVGAGC